MGVLRAISSLTLRFITYLYGIKDNVVTKLNPLTLNVRTDGRTGGQADRQKYRQKYICVPLIPFTSPSWLELLATMDTAERDFGEFQLIIERFFRTPRFSRINRARTAFVQLNIVCPLILFNFAG